MEQPVVIATISGFFSIASALISVFFKSYLDRRQQETTIPRPIIFPRPSSATRQVTKSGLSFKRPMLFLLTATLMGVVSRLSRDYLSFDGMHVEAILSLLLLLGAVIYLLNYWRKHRFNFFEVFFQIENITLWSGFVFGWSLIQGGIWTDMLVSFSAWWLASVFVGGIFLHLIKRKKGLVNIQELNESSNEEENNFKKFILRLKKLIMEDNIDEVFKSMSVYFKSENLEEPKELLLLNAKYKAYKKNLLMGTQTKETLDLEINRIRSTLIDMLQINQTQDK